MMFFNMTNYQLYITHSYFMMPSILCYNSSMPSDSVVFFFILQTYSDLYCFCCCWKYYSCPPFTSPSTHFIQILLTFPVALTMLLSMSMAMLLYFLGNLLPWFCVFIHLLLGLIKSVYKKVGSWRDDTFIHTHNF